MGFSTTLANQHRAEISAATNNLDVNSIMPPGISSLLDATPSKPLYSLIKQEEDTILCDDEMGTFYCSQKENNNIKTCLEEVVAASTCGGGNSLASTSTSTTTSVSVSDGGGVVPLMHACFCCSETINDKWLIFVNNTHWHVNCLKCSSCTQVLNDLPTCFWRENRIFCKGCYQT